VAFEAVISWAAFCQHQTEYSGADQTPESYECFFKGPVASVTRWFAEWWARTFGETEAYVALFTFVLAVGTLALWRSTHKLWIATRDTAKRQERDTEILQRAYIAVEPAGLREHRDRDDRIHPSIILRNVGHLPARQVSWRTNNSATRDNVTGEFPDFGDKIGFPIPNWREDDGAIVLPPGTASFQRVGTVFTKDLSNNFFVWGIVTYDDGFGNERFTRFCHHYSTKNIIGGLGVTLPAESARLYEYGNDAD
jgi:hypothetical protein